MTSQNKWITVFLFGFGSIAHGSEFYSAVNPTRYWGMNQGNVGSCAAEAYTTALENAFYHQGMSVRLSRFYAHSFYWYQKEQRNGPDVRATFTDADSGLHSRLGAFIPEYMLPEDSEGYNPFSTGTRPSVSSMAIVPNDYPGVNTFGYQYTWLTFTPGYTNSANLDHLKAAVNGRQAVVLSIHGALLSREVGGRNFDGISGLLVRPYSYPPAQYGITHDVAVVGYDDSIYSENFAQLGLSGPGAIVVRNSWNDRHEFSVNINAPLSPEMRLSLSKMKLKINPNVVEPGYFAIPYQYIQELISNSQRGGGINIHALNFSAFYSAYIKYQTQYQTIVAPYACEELDAPTVVEKLKRFFIHYNRARNPRLPLVERQGSAHSYMQRLEAETQPRVGLLDVQPYFDFAKIAFAPGIEGAPNRVAEFYDSKFVSYYCKVEPDSLVGIWPTLAEARNSQFIEMLYGFNAGIYQTQTWLDFFRMLKSIGAL